MAHKKFGVRPKEWWKHLKWMKRPQEKTTRQHGKKQCRVSSDGRAASL